MAEVEFLQRAYKDLDTQSTRRAGIYYAMAGGLRRDIREFELADTAEGSVEFRSVSPIGPTVVFRPAEGETTISAIEDISRNEAAEVIVRNAVKIIDSQPDDIDPSETIVV